MTVKYEKTYTLSEIARKLDRPRTTIKDWADQFEEFMPTIGEGRTMRYKESSLQLFSIIAEMRSRSEPAAAIRDVLRGVAKEINVEHEDNSGSIPLVAGIIESYNRLTNELNKVNEELAAMNEKADKTAEELTNANEKLDKTSEENAELKQLLIEQQQMIDRLREQLIETEKKSFFGKLFGK